MRCSWFESVLDQYVDATLPPKQMLAVAAHLHSCAACEALHRRLRVVDGLLHTRTMIDVGEPAFSANLMARVRAMPVPRPHHRPLWIIGAFYLICAWAAVGTVALVVRPGTGVAGAVIHGAASAWQAIAHGVHALSPVAPAAVLFFIAMFSIDVLLLASIFFFYRALRPRLAAHLAGAAETAP